MSSNKLIGAFYPPKLTVPLTAPYARPHDGDAAVTVFLASLVTVFSGFLYCFVGTMTMAGISMSLHAPSTLMASIAAFPLLSAELFAMSYLSIAITLFAAYILSPRLPALRAKSKLVTPFGMSFLLALMVGQIPVLISNSVCDRAGLHPFNMWH